MTDKEKIHQILSSLWKNDDSVGKVYYNQALQDVQTAIDLQEEPVSEELEKAIKEASEKERLHKAKNGSPFFMPTDFASGFNAGANWQKEQMMAKAIDGLVVCDNLTHGYKDIVMEIPSFLNVDDNVKVIIIKQK